MFGSRAFAFGATIAIRRQVLAGVGGFAAIANQLADDYRLGELTRALGLRTVLSDVVVETCVDERSLGDLVRHELRWLRTIRAVRPLGYSLSFVTFGVPVAMVGCLLAAGAWPALDHARRHGAGPAHAALHACRGANAALRRASARSAAPGWAQLGALGVGIRHPPRALAGRPLSAVDPRWIRS